MCVHVRLCVYVCVHAHVCVCACACARVCKVVGRWVSAYEMTNQSIKKSTHMYKSHLCKTLQAPILFGLLMIGEHLTSSAKEK